jgi:hypothetical protein
MAIITNTFVSSSAVGNREGLNDKIFSISPFDTPFVSAIGRISASAVKHEWQTDTLAAASDANAHAEGYDVEQSGFTAITPTTREENYCQILIKDIVVSGTQERVSKAGRTSEEAYQSAKRSKELRRDLEKIATGNQGYVASGTRKMRSLESWLTTNTNRGPGTSTAGADATGPTAAATDADSTRAFSETILKDVVQQVYSSGGDPTLLMVGPVNKQAVSGFSGRSSARENVTVGTISGAASIYSSDFGDLSVIPNRFQRDRSAFVLDPEYVKLAFLRDFQIKPLSVTGDNLKRMLIGEVTLEMSNEAAHGVAADLNT